MHINKGVAHQHSRTEMLNWNDDERDVHDYIQYEAYDPTTEPFPWLYLRGPNYFKDVLVELDTSKWNAYNEIEHIDYKYEQETAYYDHTIDLAGEDKSDGEPTTTNEVNETLVVDLNTNKFMYT